MKAKVWNKTYILYKLAWLLLGKTWDQSLMTIGNKPTKKNKYDEVKKKRLSSRKQIIQWNPLDTNSKL